MKTIKVNRQELIDKLVSNKEEHIKFYKDAMIGYVKAAKKALKLKIKELDSEKGNKDLYFRDLEVPASHESDYDKAIEFLTMSVDSEIELDMANFLMYVKDEWPWKHAYIFSNSKYMSK